MPPKCGYMVKQIVFGSFDHPFQDGYKSSMIQILFPWLVQGGYLNCLLLFFLYARTFTMLLACFLTDAQIHKLVSRHDHLNISKMYSVFDWKEFELLSYRWVFLESTKTSASEELNSSEKAPVQFMALWKLRGKAPVQFISLRKLSRKFHFLVRFCTSFWKRTYDIPFAK